MYMHVCTYLTLLNRLKSYREVLFNYGKRNDNIFMPKILLIIAQKLKSDITVIKEHDPAFRVLFAIGNKKIEREEKK